MTRRRAAAKRWALALAVCSVMGQGSLGAQKAAAEDAPTYFEFGTVTAMGPRSVEVQSYDPMQQGMVRHSFALDRETRADLVHVGDPVEVIYEQAGMELMLRRLLVLYGGIPKAGPPNNGIGLGDAAVVIPLGRPVGSVAAANGASAGASGSGAATSAADKGATKMTGSASTAAAPATAAASGTTGRNGSNGRAASSTATKAVGAKTSAATSASTAASAKANTGAAYGASPVNLGNAAGPRPTVVIPVNVGEMLAAVQPVAKAVLRDQPTEECNRSSAEWPRATAEYCSAGLPVSDRARGVP